MPRSNHSLPQHLLIFRLLPLPVLKLANYPPRINGLKLSNRKVPTKPARRVVTVCRVRILPARIL